jgi:hypothetical protein
MSRTLAASLAGAAAGFLAGYVGIAVVGAGRPEATDAAAITLFLGSFLAAAGAIAGAVIGGVADMREFHERNRCNKNQDESEKGGTP